MTAVDRIKSICKERKIAISKLEADCGYGNGYVSSLKKGILPYDRLCKIADYLNVTPYFLMYGKEEDFSDETAHLVAKIRKDTELSKALQKYFELSDAKKKHVVELINLLAE